MPATVYKNLNKNSPGTSTTYGADDWDILGRWHLDVDLSATQSSSIKTNTSFWDNRLRVWNPAKTKSYRIRGLAILNDYDLTLPLLTGNDEFAALLATQEMQNKTFNVNLNTLRNTSNSKGQLLVGDGSKYLPLTMGSTAGHVLRINSSVDGLEWGLGSGGGGGEVNTASNVGTAGVGMFKQKTGVNLEFKKLNTASGGLITVTDDTASSEVDLKITGGTDGQFLKTVGTTPTWSTLSGAARVMPDGTSYTGARWGAFLGGTSQGDGLWNVFTGGTLGVERASTYTASSFTTAAVDNDQAGMASNLSVMQRDQSPRLKFEFREAQTTEKLWIGMEPGSFTGGDNPMAANTGVMVGHDSGDANYLIRWNDGTATEQTYNTGTAKNTTYNTIEFFLDHAAGAVKISWGGTQVVNSTAQVPAATTGLNIHAWCEAEGATATTMYIKYGQLTFG